MDNNVLTVILSSSVITTMVTAVVSLITNKRENRLKYAMNEDPKWREEIREIAYEIETGKRKDIHKSLAKLKVRINPYGDGKEKEYLQDSHIWRLIHCLENEDYEEYDDEKDKLLVALSLLLKFDWERSKKLITGKKTYLGMLVTIAFGIAYLVYMHFVECDMEYNEYFLMTFALFIMYPIILPQIQPIKSIKNSLGNKPIWKTVRQIVWLIGQIFVLFVLTASVCENYGITYEYLMSSQAYGEGSIVIFVMTLLAFMSYELTENSIEAQYIKAVEKFEGQKKNEVVKEGGVKQILKK